MNFFVKKNVNVISYGMGFLNVLNVVVNVSVFVNIDVFSFISVIVFNGNGCVMIFIIVVKKIDSSCYVFFVMFMGVGMNYINMFIVMDVIRGFMDVFIYGFFFLGVGVVVGIMFVFVFVCIFNFVLLLFFCNVGKVVMFFSNLLFIRNLFLEFDVVKFRDLILFLFCNLKVFFIFKDLVE